MCFDALVVLQRGLSLKLSHPPISALEQGKEGVARVSNSTREEMGWAASG